MALPGAPRPTQTALGLAPAAVSPACAVLGALRVGVAVGRPRVARGGHNKTMCGAGLAQPRGRLWHSQVAHGRHRPHWA